MIIIPLIPPPEKPVADSYTMTAEEGDAPREAAAASGLLTAAPTPHGTRLPYRHPAEHG
ncbi:MAG TPA: hypothetical protein PKM57_16905 [Kiritimatiellia bacterium]|nr:hypothetical protein [Kiritimatiellia bacterium]HPS09350.1 hypothetical protein [Kiritimatiellia bacterium]